MKGRRFKDDHKGRIRFPSMDNYIKCVSVSYPSSFIPYPNLPISKFSGKCHRDDVDLYLTETPMVERTFHCYVNNHQDHIKEKKRRISLHI